MLTGSYPLSETMRGLLEGAPFAVLATPELTHVAAVAVQSVRPVLRGDNERKIAAALGLFEAGVDTAELERRIALPRPERVTPLMFEYDLIERARADRRHIVLPEGDDDRILRAAEILLRRGVVDLTILGAPDDVRERAAALGVDLDGAGSSTPSTRPLRDEFAEHYYELRKHRGMTEERAFDILADPSYFGTMLVQEGAVDGMVSGAAHTTGDTIRPAFEIIRRGKAPRSSRASSSCASPDRVLVYGDCAVNPKPDPQQLADIAISSAETAAQFGVEPRIAMLSYSTGESAAGPDVDAVREATEIVRERRPGSRWSKGRSSTTPPSTPPSPPLKLPDSRGRRAGDGARLPRPRHRERRLQGGAALVGRRRDRAGAPGPAQAGQRPQPRLHASRTSSTRSRSPGSRRRRPSQRLPRPSDQAV